MICGVEIRPSKEFFFFVYSVSHAQDAYAVDNLEILSGALLGMLDLLEQHKIWR